MIGFGVFILIFLALSGGLLYLAFLEIINDRPFWRRGAALALYLLLLLSSIILIRGW